MTAVTRQKSRILSAAGAKMVGKAMGAVSDAGLAAKLPDIEDVAFFTKSRDLASNNLMLQALRHANSAVTLPKSGLKLSVVDHVENMLGASRSEGPEVPSAAGNVATSTLEKGDIVAEMLREPHETGGLGKPRVKPLDHKHRGHLSVTDIKSCVRCFFPEAT